MTVEHETPKPDIDSEVAALAQLTPLEYDQVRSEKAEQLNVRLDTLDKEVAKLRCDQVESSYDKVVEEIDPWDEPVNGADLLNELATTIDKHVILPKGAAIALSVWSLGSYCMDAWRIWPKLLITSPEKRCGKSTLLETIEGTVYQALLASNISPSAIYRCIEAWAPSMLIDEADTFTKDNDELNGIINAGHTKRNAGVVRSGTSEDGFKPRRFSVWCPMVIAGIGEQRGTLHDRSIHIELRRKLPDETSVKLPLDYYEQMQTIRRKCLRWAEDNLEALKLSDVEVPDCRNDRAQDNWHPMFRIAKVAGCNWPDKVRGAYTIFTQAAESGSEDAGHMLIEDISKILEKWPLDNIFSKTLVERLIELEDRPWFEWKRGKPLTQNSLAKLLKPYQLTSGTKRISHGRAKGYEVAKIKAAFKPYLHSPLPQSVTPLQPLQDKASSVTVGGHVTVQSVTPSQSVTCKPLQEGACHGVTVEPPQVERDILNQEVF